MYTIKYVNKELGKFGLFAVPVKDSLVIINEIDKYKAHPEIVKVLKCSLNASPSTVLGLIKNTMSDFA